MITNYFVKGGTWNLYVDKVDSYATVNVGFSHNDNDEDETQFDISYPNIGELNTLFNNFVAENNFENVKILYVNVIKTAHKQMSNKLKVQRLDDGLIIGYSRKDPFSPPVMVVGRKRMNDTLVIINAFEGKEAEELYKKLTTVEKKDDANG